jgi:hypothetical protein
MVFWPPTHVISNLLPIVFYAPSLFTHFISNPCIWYYDPLHQWYTKNPAYDISTLTAYGILTPLPKLW